MKSYFQIALLISCLPAFGAHGAAFQNLDFESGTLVPIPGDRYNRVYFDQAFPGWRGYVGTNQEAAAFHNGDFLCCSAITLWGGASHPEYAIEGTYSVFLHAALGPDSQPADTSIAQTGILPLEARSLLFKARETTGPGLVSLGGSLLPIIPLSVTSDYTLYGADISAWAGREAELRFTAVAPPTLDHFWGLDAIQFSTTPIPEPSTFALFALAAAFGWFYRRRKRR
jgi:PEP-CTERM motif-containing protein